MESQSPVIAPLCVGVAGFCGRGPGVVCRPRGLCQPPAVPLSESQLGLPTASEGADPSAFRPDRYSLHLILPCSEQDGFGHVVNMAAFSSQVILWTCCQHGCFLLTGHTVDMACLHLLHGDPSAHTWTDITSQASLCVTHLYAIFYITHFSW